MPFGNIFKTSKYGSHSCQKTSTFFYIPGIYVFFSALTKNMTKKDSNIKQILTNIITKNNKMFLIIKIITGYLAEYIIGDYLGYIIAPQKRPHPNPQNL